MHHSLWGSWFVLSIFGLAVAVALLLVNTGTSQASGTTSGSNVSAPLAPTPFGTQRTPMPVVGSPAITPHPTTTSSSARSGTSTFDSPTFSASDASAYITTHPMWRNLAVWAPPTVVQVAFYSSKQVSTLLGGESTGMPDNTLLCYVELRGTFTFAGPNGTTATFSTGFEVFDAHTGNFLMAGGLH
jgi:hypothetical protein